MRRWGNDSTGIGDITVNKQRLLEKLTENRNNHQKIFLEALEKFREQAIKELNQVIDTIKAGKLPRIVGASLPIPEEHTDDYDRAISMLKMHTEPTITLSEEAYARLVDDNWGWRDSFNASTVAYVSSR